MNALQNLLSVAHSKRATRTLLLPVALGLLSVGLAHAQAVTTVPSSKLKPIAGPLAPPRTNITPPKLKIALPKHWDFEDGTLQGFQVTDGSGNAFNGQPTFGNNVRASRALDTSHARLPANPCAGLVLDERTTCEYGKGATYGYLVALKNDLGRLHDDLIGIGGSYWDTAFPIGNQGQYWLGTGDSRKNTGAAAWGSTQPNSATGQLVFSDVELQNKYFHLLVGGGCSEQVGVYLQAQRPVIRGSLINAPGAHLTLPGAHATTPTVSSEWYTLSDADGKPIAARGACLENMARFVFDVSNLKGTKARIMIEDRASDEHINVDDIWLTDSAPRPSSRGSDPVWGVADLHAHLMNEKGYISYSSTGIPESRALWGSAFGGIDSLKGCNDTHTTNDWNFTSNQDEAWGTTYTLCRDVCLNLIEGAGLPDKEGDQIWQDGVLGGYHNTDGGYPYFKNWPMWYSAIHQQMHASWVKRAYQGGVRLIVASVGNSEIISFALSKEKDRPFTSDQDAIALQIPAIKEFVRQNSDWTEIAYTPLDARRIINSGKLAIVIGVELDHVMDTCNADATRTSHHVAQEYAHPDVWASENGYDIGVAGGVTGAAAFIGAATRVMHYPSHPNTCSDAQIEARVEALYQQGVREIIPMHFSDNLFGGYAVNGDLFIASAIFGDAGAHAPVLLSQTELERRYGDSVKPFTPVAREAFYGENAQRRERWQRALPFSFKLSEATLPIWAKLDPTSIVDGDAIPPGIGRAITEFFSGQCIQDEGWRIFAGIFTLGGSELACGLTSLTMEAIDGARSTMPYEGATDSAAMIPVDLNAQQNALSFHMNSRGLQPAGRTFIQSMMQRGMLVDIQHSSELTKEDILAMAGSYPLLASHGGVSGGQRANENVLSMDQLAKIYSPPNSFAGGVVGLGTQSSRGLVEQIRLVAGAGESAGQRRNLELARRGVALGTDLNGMDWHAGPRFGQFADYDETPVQRHNRQISGNIGLLVKYASYPAASNPWASSLPSCDPACTSWSGLPATHTALNPSQVSKDGQITRTFDINYDGLAHFGMLPDFLQELTVLGTSGEEMGTVFRSAEALVRAWEESCFLAYENKSHADSIIKGCGDPANYK